MKSFTALVAAAATALFLSSCTTPASDGHTDHEHGSESSVAGQPSGFNADDVAFATDMIPHHRQAVEMSAMVPDRSTDPEVVSLAKTIADAQGPEIETMTAWLAQWKQPPAGTGHEGHQGMDMNGMVDGATMTKLTSLKGTAFDELWLQSMIGHHEGAIEMAKAEIANGENTDAKELAQHVVDSQQTEIVQMKQMLGG